MGKFKTYLLPYTCDLETTLAYLRLSGGVIIVVCCKPRVENPKLTNLTVLVLVLVLVLVVART